VINKVDDVLLISLAVTCDQQVAPSDLRYTLFCGYLLDGCIKHWLPPVRPSVLCTV